ncbi:protein-L-isoaspartate O-methyltransferase [Candidatus Woesearchaeota archaeon]|jgi:protein-L-isoaspartate(D-aspartate) O-methyltransferase|nr:protein-L-isoaspartate O-methyltransferase [Candidatus Woesearchaeota archaeon]|tara:strand:- start:33825 stop:34466 length:642 start_codon:yes stop_codon:yes gene_type:complete
MIQKSGLLEFWKENFSFRDIELRAFREVKREDFIPEKLKNAAYEDMPLPLMRGKTISQPTTVMMMTNLLELEKGEKVFEIGTGSGYQAAIAASIVGPKGKVITTEVVPELIHFAKQNLKKAKINNVAVYEEDGSKGYKKEAPYDKIIITAACKEFPKELLDQLKPNGMIVGPVGNQNEQEMVRGIKDKNGHLELEFFGQFLFTPMYGKYGFEI